MSGSKDPERQGDGMPAKRISQALPTHISVSQLRTYLTCGEKYRIQRLEGAPDMPGWAGIAGNAIHEAAEVINREFFESGSCKIRTDDIFQLRFEALIAEKERYSGFTQDQFTAYGRATKEWPDKQNRAYWEVSGPEHVARYLAWITARYAEGWTVKGLPDGSPAVEAKFDVWVGVGEDRAILRGSIDLILDTPDGIALMTDVKSGSRKEDNLRQLGFYRVAAQRAWGIDTPVGTFVMTKNGEHTSPEMLDAYTPELVDDVASKFLRARKHDIYLANPGQACTWCSVTPYCAETGGHLANTLQITTKESA